MFYVAVMKAVDNSVQAKSVIDNFEAQGYYREHIHVFAYSSKRAEDIAHILHVDAVAPNDSDDHGGLLATIQSFFEASSDDLYSQLSGIGLSEHDQALAKDELEQGKLVVVAHHPQE